MSYLFFTNTPILYTHIYVHDRFNHLFSLSNKESGYVVVYFFSKKL